MELLDAIILFFVGVFAAFMNVTAGGGSSVTVPALIFLGVDPIMANGTNRLAIMFQNVSASASFRHENVRQTRYTYIYALLTLPGAVLGSIYATEISSEVFKQALVVVIIGVIIMILLPRSRQTFERAVSDNGHAWLVYPGFFVLGFYGGFIQVGIGFLIIALVQRTLHVDLIKTNMHKVFAIMSINVPALLVFALTGNMNWGLGTALAAGTVTGAWWAAKISVRKGDRFIRYFFALALAVISVRLLGLF